MKIILRACALLLLLCLCVPAIAQTAEKKPSADKKAAPAAAKKTAKAKAPVPALPSLVWRGDHNTARAFMKDFAKDYEASKQGRFALTPFSTISGLDAVNDGTADIAGSSRPPMPGRTEEATTNFYPVAWDGLVMITSPKNPVGNLTLKQIQQIYLGHLTNWAELGGPDGPINLYAVAGPLDGSEYSLRDIIFHHGDQAVAVPRLYVNVDKLEEGIAIDPHGLGVSTLSSAHANPGLKMLTVEGIAASPASIADGSYPLYSPLFLASREDSPKKEAIQNFMRYVGSEPAQAVLRRHSLVPYGEAPNLPSRQAQRVAYVDALVRPEVVAAAAAAASTGSAPLSAPVASADFLTRTAPNAPGTQEAKDRAAQILLEKQAQKSDGVSGH